MNVRVLVEAQAEAVEASHWYESKRTGLGYEFLSEVAVALQSIPANPQSFAKWESYRGPHDIRRAAMSRFPYGVIFLCREEECLVVAIAHARRHPLYWLDRIA